MRLEDQLKVYEYMYSYYRRPLILHMFRGYTLRTDQGFCRFIGWHNCMLSSLTNTFGVNLYPDLKVLTDLKPIDAPTGGFWYKEGAILPRRELLKKAIKETKRQITTCRLPQDKREETYV